MGINESSDGAVKRLAAITGKENIENVRLLALRSALKLEVRGLKRRGRSARTIAQEVLGLPGRPGARKVYAALDKHITSRLGPTFASPLEDGK